jgi:pimeloyl-ACP methyl ester carboxylesterase
MRDILVKVVNESYEGQLNRNPNLVTLIWGAEDTEVPVWVAVAAAAILANATLVVLPGVGHMVPLQAPEALTRAIDEAMA